MSYSIHNGVLTSYSGDDVNIVIPPEVNRIDSMVFFAKSNIKSAVIHGGVKAIGQGAFFNCSALKTVVIGSGVEVIETFAFRGCESLKSITIPSSVTEIQPMAFDDDIEIKSAGGASPEPEPKPEPEPEVRNPYADNPLVAAFLDPSFSYTAPTEEIQRPISEDADFEFEWGDGGYILTKCLRRSPDIVIPDEYMGERVVGIGDQAFATKVTLSDDGESGSVDPNKWLESVTLPMYCEYIGKHAFACCLKLKEVGFNEGLTSIKDFAFLGCSSLERVILPSTCTHIHQRAFAGCIGVSEISIPKDLKAIGEEAFGLNCLGGGIPKITKIELPASCEAHDRAFSDSIEVSYYFGKEDIPMLLSHFISTNNLQHKNEFYVKNIAQLKSILCIPSSESVMLARDNSAFGNGKLGWIWTERGIYQKTLGNPPEFFSWEDFLTIESFDTQTMAGASVFFQDADHKQWGSRFKLDSSAALGLIYNVVVNLHGFLLANISLDR